MTGGFEDKMENQTKTTRHFAELLRHRFGWIGSVFLRCREGRMVFFFSFWTCFCISLKAKSFPIGVAVLFGSHDFG